MEKKFFLMLISFVSLHLLFPQVNSSATTNSTKIIFNSIESWGLNVNNNLRLEVKGLTKKSILIVDFYPILPQNYDVGPVPNVRNVSFLSGVTLMKQIESDGVYDLNFKKTAFSTSQWFGQDNPEFDGWTIDAYLAKEIIVQTMPESGVKKIGKKISLKPDQLTSNFHILSNIVSNGWVNHIQPSKVYYIELSSGGLFTWITNDNIITKSTVLFTPQLKIAPKIKTK